MLKVLGDSTCWALHQQLLHPPKQCRDGGSLHVQSLTQCGHTRITVRQCSSVFFNPELQCPSSFTNVGHITRAAWDPINYSFPALLGYWVFCVHKHLWQCSVRNLNQWTEIEDSSPQYMIPSSEPTHHQTFFYVDNVALSSSMVHCHLCFSFPASRQGIVPHLVLTSGCFYVLYQLYPSWFSLPLMRTTVE